MSMGGAIPEENKKERIIPIRILKSPHVIHEEDEDEENEENEVRGEARGEQKQEPQQSKRHSLSVELDDGTITETQGTSIPLSSTEMDKEEFQTSTTSSTSRTEHIRIEEIGIDTMKREIRGASPNSEKVQKGNGSSIIRLVPISLPDGKLIQADSEETLTTTSEYTTTTHEEFPSPPSGCKPTKNSKIPDSPSISVPINVASSRAATSSSSTSKKEETEFKSPTSPHFLHFEDISGPSDWESFPSAKASLPGNGEEKVIPIILEHKKSDQPQQQIFSSKESKSSSSTSTKTFEDILVTEETLARNGYKSDKKPEAGRPTVRFSVDSDDTIKRKKEETENEIHKIDQDISKIWNDLKELDSEPRPGSSVSSWPKTTNPPPRYPKQQPPIPHKVSVLESPKYTPIRESSLTRPGVIKSSSPGSTLKSLKTNDLNNPFGPIDENSSLQTTNTSIDTAPRKSSTASMTVVTSSYKPTPSFAKPLTIKGGVVKPVSSQDEIGGSKEVVVVDQGWMPSSIMPSITQSSSKLQERELGSEEISTMRNTLDKETQTSSEHGKKENCSLM